MQVEQLTLKNGKVLLLHIHKESAEFLSGVEVDEKGVMMRDYAVEKTSIKTRRPMELTMRGLVLIERRTRPWRKK